MVVFFFQAEDGIRDLVRSRGLGDVYKRQTLMYDAYTIVENAEGEDLSHWDIGLLKFWEDGQYLSLIHI